MDAVISIAPRRHPWLDLLIAAPAAEVRALNEGTASIHPFRRAEPSDAAATILFGLGADDPAIKAFDQGVLETLALYRAATARAQGEQRERIALAALDLMTVIQQLTPRNTVIDLHRRFAYWNAWAETLVVDRGFDLRREYWRALALTQDIAADADLAPRRLLPFWLEICGEAGRRGRYEDSYLVVGLLGLRSLPLGEEAANEEAALHGLARWADAQRPTKPRFLREWHVLEGAFPRDATFWTDLVARVLASVEEEIARQTDHLRGTFPAAGWWREDVEAILGQAVASHASVEPASQSEWQSILDDMRERAHFRTLTPRIAAVIRKNEHYASRTGNTFYLVRTACNIGMRLLGGGDEPTRRASKAAELARLALQFEPANVYAWALWRDALAAEGHLEAAELIGWETIRRFPENPQWRNQLALLLVGVFRRPEDAEELLKETIGLFPNAFVAQNQLALLLANQRGRSREAETLLWEAIRKSPKDSKSFLVAHTQLANVVGRDPARLKEAIALLQQALVIEPTNNIAIEMKRRFELGRTSVPPPAAAPSEPSPPQSVVGILPTNVATSARMRRVLFRVRTTASTAREAALQEIKTMLREDENLAYARYVAAASGVGELTTDDTLLPVAFLAAGSEGSTETLKPILERSRGIEGVIVSLASASRGDEEAAMRLKAWLAEPTNDLSPRDHGLRVIAERVAGPVSIEFVGDMLAASLGTALAA